jgi:hypothetical protein
MKNKLYNRGAAVDYARRWALARNPNYSDFSGDELGGDCTNFVSQCLYAGAGVMNFQQYGWFYRSLNHRAPAWTGVGELFDFLTKNTGAGPAAEVVELSQAQPGDIVQLKLFEDDFTHSLLIVGFENNEKSPETTLLACHSADALDKRLGEYPYAEFRVLHINRILSW